MANFSGNFCNSDNGKVLSSFYSHNDLSHHGGFQGHSIFQMNEIDHRFYGRDIQNDSLNFRRDFYADLAATKAAYSLSGCHPQFVNSIASTTNMYGMGSAASNMYGMGGTTSNIYSMSAFGLEGRYSSYSNVSSGSSHNRGHYDGTGAVNSENNARDFTSLCEEEKHCSFANGENVQSEGTFCKNYNSSYVSDQRRYNVIDLQAEEEDVKHPVTDENALNVQGNPSNDKLFFCKLCGKNITIVNSFEKSMADHAKLYHGSIYFCLFCDKSYKWKKSLDKHLVKFHPHSTPFSCELCGKEFRNNYSLSDHKNSHCNLETKFTDNMHHAKSSFSNPYQEKCFTCPLCSGSFITKDSLRKHIKSIHLTESIHDCEICGKECKDEINIGREVENRDFPLICDICKKCFCSLSTLNKHKQAVHSFGKPECNICGKDFASFDIMKRHMLLHSDEVKYLCEVCGKTFVRLDRFNKHMKRHMGDRPFQCVTCQKTFRDKYILNLHSRKHTGERPFLCNICGKSFSSKSTLRIHISRHTGDSQYKCDICNKTFAYSTYRTAHMRIHTNEKPFKCNICSKEFTQKCSLNFHMLRHSGEKKHTCTVCKKAFLHLSYLNIHMRTHTGEKPYKCSSCNKEFSQKSTLNTHKRKCP